jgi:AraC-like DNA-binding protein
MKLRIQAACEALQREGANISDVSRDLGFCDQSALTHHFHRHMGMTPLKYLQQFRLRRV